MNTKHTTKANLMAALAAGLLLVASAASAERGSTPQKIREVPDLEHLVEVEIWTDRGDNSRYCTGDSIEIFFRTNVDAWVAIYDVDTRGKTHRLFPSRSAPDNFVRGGEVHRLPSRYGHHFEVEGPAGWETLRAVASTDRRALYDHGYTPAHYRPTIKPLFGGDSPSLKRIHEVPDERPAVAVAEARHYVRDGYRCQRPRPRPWYYRR